MKQILVVDDDPRIGRGLSVRLKFAGYVVQTAADGVTGLKLALEFKPDLVILDIMMPVGGGYSVAYRLREQAPELPVIFITASKQPQLREMAEKLDAVGFFEKPYEFEELLAAVKAAFKSESCWAAAPEPSPKPKSRANRIATADSATPVRQPDTPGNPLSLPWQNEIIKPRDNPNPPSRPARHDSGPEAGHRIGKRDSTPTVKKILIVDDDAAGNVVQTIKESLNFADYQLFIAADGESGLNLAMKYKPDLVILDIDMTGKGGPSVIRRLQQQAPALPIILILTSRHTGLRDTPGNFSFLEKPYEPRELLKLVAKALAAAPSPVADPPQCPKTEFPAPAPPVPESLEVEPPRPESPKTLRSRTPPPRALDTAPEIPATELPPLQEMQEKTTQVWVETGATFHKTEPPSPRPSPAPSSQGREKTSGAVRTYAPAPTTPEKALDLRLANLRLAAPAGYAPKSQPELVAITGRNRILIVEDDRRIVMALALRLQNAGQEVIQAFDALSGVEAAIQYQPDLILMDINLPGGSGLIVAQRIQSVLPKPPPIIFLTASQQPGLREKALALGAAGFLEKPYDPKHLLTTIQKALPAAADKPPQSRPPAPTTSENAPDLRLANLSMAAPSGNALKSQPKLVGITGRNTILIVEDDRRIAMDLTAQLQSAGQEVIRASDEMSGVAAATKHRPDLILMDIDLPGGSALMVAQRIQSVVPKLTPIIFLTAGQQPGLRQKALALGAAGFLEKTHNSADLLTAIQNALGLGRGDDPTTNQGFFL